jgi:hypothetical protein
VVRLGREDVRGGAGDRSEMGVGGVSSGSRMKRSWRGLGPPFVEYDVARLNEFFDGTVNEAKSVALLSEAEESAGH